MTGPTQFRTDRNNNPTAMITQMAEEGGLVLGTDYEQGDSFGSAGTVYFTAKLLGDPIALTIKVIDKLGFYTTAPHARWTYIAIPYDLWLSLTENQKQYVIGFMYGQEGGTEMRSLFKPLDSPTPIGIAVSSIVPLSDKLG
jgi:hypothetical protein